MGKKGSVTVFLMIFFVSVISCTAVFIYQSAMLSVKGSAESISTVIAQSVLAEYDINLKNHYEIFGFYGLDRDVNRKCDFYAKENFMGKAYINYEGSKCSVADYSLCNIDIFKKQITEAGKLAMAGKLIRKEKHNNSELKGNKQIRNESITYYLPSKGAESRLPLLRLARLLKESGSIKDIIKAGGERVYINAYAENFFKNAWNRGEKGESFFQYEEEYLICGKTDDNSNYRGVRNRIIAIREILNYGFLKSDPEKYSMVLTAAEILTPGPAAAATAEALISSWAMAESINDFKLLENGHKIPVIKTSATWATDLDSVINNREEGCIFTGIEKGENYEDYISFLLYCMDRDILLLRMMDLIQINMKYLYYEDFMLKEYNGGVHISYKVNGDTYEYEKEY